MALNPSSRIFPITRKVEPGREPYSGALMFEGYGVGKALRS